MELPKKERENVWHPHWLINDLVMYSMAIYYNYHVHYQTSYATQGDPFFFFNATRKYDFWISNQGIFPETLLLRVLYQ